VIALPTPTLETTQPAVTAPTGALLNADQTDGDQKEHDVQEEPDQGQDLSGKEKVIRFRRG